MQAKYSFRAVNLLLFIVMCLQVANVALMWMPQYVRLILNEILFVFLPAYLYLRFTRQPVAERVRWNWPGWKIAALSLLIGMGLYPLSAANAGWLINLLGYTNFAGAPDAIPTTLLMSVLAVIAYAVMAPLCEEFLFRGVIQPVYEQRGPKWAVFFVGFLFIAFHFSLLQGLSIVLLALALGWVNLRTRSLPASILTHVGANALAALVITQNVFKTGIQNWIVSAPLILGGLAAAAGAAAALVWLTRRPVDTPLAAPEAAVPDQPARPGWLAVSWPLLAAAVLYLAMISAEFFYARSPQAAAAPLKVETSPWQTEQKWAYEIRNAADAAVGDGECRVTPDGAEMGIVCWSKVGAYEVKVKNGTYSSSGGERTDALQWQTADGRLLTGSSNMSLSDGSYGAETSWGLGTEAIEIHMTVKGEPQKDYTLPLSENSAGEQQRAAAGI